ncbi:MAG TPA: SDR family NAD(P)-dependent oxidoreductase [Oligoflexia bacterium]|nr:SDR family NAD(P)-dependent oxidoreductase [Oligoflexia bacterium]
MATTNEKKALITGASEGIGRDLCVLLAKQGFTITGVARNSSRLESLISELKKISPAAHDFQVCDLGQPSDVARLGAFIESHHYDVLVNNAGFGAYGEFSRTPLQKLESMIQLNCTALVALAHAFLRGARPGDALVNIASVAAFISLPGNAVYSATKAFVHNLTVSLWFEGKRRGVYVCSICPGYTDTQFASRAGGDPNKAPRTFAITSEAVAASIVRAIQKRTSVQVVPDVMNRIMVFLLRFLPQTWIVRAVHRATRKAFGE